jgi:aryl-alcohol dehydrogenase-like predicted oxidoreductase
MATTSTTHGIPAAAAGTITLGGDLTVNRLGFGAMRLTGKGIWGPPRDRAEAIRVLQRSVELGVNFIDTAYSYGPEVSEQIIADALYPYPGLVIATKGGLERPGPNQWVENGRPEFLRRNLQAASSAFGWKGSTCGSCIESIPRYRRRSSSRQYASSSARA